MHNQLKGKKAKKGGQRTVAVGICSRYMYAWTQWHKGFEENAPFAQEGPTEIQRLYEGLTPLVTGQPQEEEDGRRQIFTQKSSLKMDNHFSGAHVDACIDEEGYKTIYTRQAFVN